MRYFIAAAVLSLSVGLAHAQTYDLVIEGARVVDPETALDQVRNIGITGDEIAIVTPEPITGASVIDATGLIAAPGFIDLHAHGQDRYSEKVSIFDGRTTQMDLEAGALPVSDYFAAKAGVSLSNYGVSVSHAAARLMVMDGINAQGSPMMTHALQKAGATGNLWAVQRATDAQLDQIDDLVRQGVEEGGIGIGVMVGYYPNAQSEGVTRMAQLAAAEGSFLTTHPRYLSIISPSGVLGQEEFVALGMAYDVPILLHHVPTNALSATEQALDIIEAANRNGGNILGEAFPYVRGSSFIAAEILAEGWQERTGMDYDDLIWVETGETLTQETFEKYRSERPDGFFLMEHIMRKDMLAAVLHPDIIIASDGMPLVDDAGASLPFATPFGVGNGHPRSAGTFGAYLRIAIDDGSLTMPQIIAKTGFIQAKFLEPFAPEMHKRGRLQAGAFADITIFDPDTVKGVAGYTPGTNSLPSEGFVHVIVNGQPVVTGGQLVEDIFPGVAIRASR
ncbi:MULTISPECIES: amidohydrolase family protein [unclassified Ruegeria]|uniref:amidohydrolase family protein n=1 Tax=unclassified Ruegeria TaxID=2625375 RepID=UPI001AE52A48|nr:MULTISPECIES: amidohydrolase family protein [unclassified Ruegeria]